MYRSMMQVYVKNSAEALKFYERVFGAKALCSYPDSEGRIMHSELNISGQIFALSELIEGEVVTGNAMQFCLHFGEGSENAVRRIYEALKEDATLIYPLEKCDYSPLMADLVDRYGVRWCIFV